MPGCCTPGSWYTYYMIYRLTCEHEGGCMWQGERWRPTSLEFAGIVRNAICSWKWCHSTPKPDQRS